MRESEWESGRGMGKWDVGQSSLSKAGNSGGWMTSGKPTSLGSGPFSMHTPLILAGPPLST